MIVEKARKMGVKVKSFTQDCLTGFSIVVDCLLGTGFNGTVRESYRAAIEAINASNAFVVSVDINSGMNGDTGECDLAVRSDLTVTIGYVKHGLVTPNAGRYMQRLVCADIGIVLCGEEIKLLSPEEWQQPHGENCRPAPPWLVMEPISVL